MAHGQACFIPNHQLLNLWSAINTLRKSGTLLNKNLKMMGMILNFSTKEKQRLSHYFHLHKQAPCRSTRMSNCHDYIIVLAHDCCNSRVPSRRGFGGLNPHQNHLDPHFIWPWVQWVLTSARLGPISVMVSWSPWSAGDHTPVLSCNML